MRIIKIIFTAIMLYSNLFAQELKTIRFVYSGIETKPHGTLLISVGKLIQPTDKGSSDAVLGRGFVTDQKTFDFLTNYISKNKFTISNKNELGHRESFYIIIDAEKKVHYLKQKNFFSFFGNLRSEMKEQGLDSSLREVLEYYYSNWRNPK
jgi:hypothetical protein